MRTVVYKCDRCKSILQGSHLLVAVRLTAQAYNQVVHEPLEAGDLCRECLSLLEGEIERFMELKES